MKVSDIKCVYCGVTAPSQKPGQYMVRTRLAPGGELHWKCAPSCNSAHASQEAAVLAAIEGEEEKR